MIIQIIIIMLILLLLFSFLVVIVLYTSDPIYTNKHFSIQGGKMLTFSARPNQTSVARFDGRHYLSCKVSINNRDITSFSVDIIFAREAKFN